MKSESVRIRLHESGERCIAGKRGHRPQPWRHIDGRDVPQNFTLPHSKAQTQGTRAAVWSRVFGPGRVHAKASPFDHLFNGSEVCCIRLWAQWMQSLGKGRNSKVLRFAADGRVGKVS